jgi:iron complex outermembrane receptor protein
MSIQSVRTRACAGALAAAALAAPAMAQSAPASGPQPAADPSDTIIIVGQSEEPITVVPRGLSVSLGETQFEAVNAVNVEDLMKYAPNFFVRKRFAGDDNAVVALRGANTIQSARTIVLVDGFLVSNFLGNRWDFPPKWNVVGPNEVRQFDIVYGPYSARYGGNSMGGVVSITTQSPRENGAYLTGQAMIMPFEEYGFDETFSGYSLEGGLDWAPANAPLRVRAGFRSFNNTGQSQTYNLLSPATGSAPATDVTGAYVDPRLASPVFGAASPVNVSQEQYRLRADLDLAGGWLLEALAFAWRTEQSLSDTRTFLKDTSGNPVGLGRVRFNGAVWNATGLTMSGFNRTEYLAGLKLSGDALGWRTAINLSRYWIPDWETRTSSNFATGRSDGAGTLQSQDNPGWWVLDAGIERDIGRHALAFGVNANRYETAQDTFNVSAWRQGTSPAFASSTAGVTALWGVYAEDTIALSARTDLTAGIRYDQWRASDGLIARQSGSTRIGAAYPRRDDDAISPKLSLQTRLSDNVSVQLSVGSAVRFPTVGELFQGQIDTVTQQIDPQSFDPDLRPERSQDINLILRSDLDAIRLTTSVFYQNVEDAIFSFQGLNQFGNIRSGYKNVEQVRQYGVEVIAEASDVLRTGLDVEASLTWMDARTIRNDADPRAEGVSFPRIPDWRINGNIRYPFSPSLAGSLGWRYASRPNSDLLGLVRGDAYGFQSEYLIVDTRLNWDVSDSLRLSAGVDNINNDKAYVAHPLPQRTFIMEARWRR